MTPAPMAGRVALVTGAASGIGAACAMRLARDGATVWCTDVSEQGAHATAQALMAAGLLAHARALDVTDVDAWQRVSQEVGVVHVLVHAAGISAGSPFVDMTLESWRHVHRVNLDGTFLAVQHGVRLMRDAGGSIAVIASASGIRPAPGAAAYASSKAAVRMLVRTVAKECLTSGIPVRINSVSPAGVRTPMWSAQPFFREMVERLGSEDAAYAALETGPGASRFATPDEVAAAVAYLTSEAAAHVTGTDLVIDDGYTL